MSIGLSLRFFFHVVRVKRQQLKRSLSYSGFCIFSLITVNLDECTLQTWLDRTYVSLSVCICQSVCVSVCLSVCLFVCLSASPPLSLFLSVPLALFLSASLSLSLSVCLSLCFVSISVYIIHIIELPNSAMVLWPVFLLPPWYDLGWLVDRV